MIYLYMALAVFTVVRLVQLLVDAPQWVWQIVVLVVSLGIFIPWRDDADWFLFLSVAGISTLLQHLENLMIARADESLSAIIRRR